MIRPDPTKKGPLNDSHRRRIGAAFAVIEERLDEIERRISGPLSSGELRRRSRDLAPEAAADIAEQVQTVRNAVRSAIGVLGLTPQSQGDSKSIHTAAVFSLIDLDNLEPTRIKGYGRLDAESEHTLQEILNTLKEPLEEIRRLAELGERTSEVTERDASDA
ncbi:MAG: hypothetical protein P8Z49_01930 [Acidobacteriota bacterium]